MTSSFAVTVYTPVRDAEAWAASVSLPKSARWVVVDSGSTDDTVHVLRTRGVEVLETPEPRGRIANWRQCLEHFTQSKACWMRWLFAGDVLSDDSFPATLEAAAAFSSARLIVGGYVNDLGSGRVSTVLPVNETLWTASADSLWRSVAEGNWFGPPLALWLHRELVESGVYDFGHYEWAADFHAAHRAATEGGCLAVPVVQGTFHAPQRRFYQERQDSAQARLETLGVRLDALLQLKNCGEHPPEALDVLWRVLERQCWSGIFQSRVTNGAETDYLQELVDRVPMRLIGPILQSRARRLGLRFQAETGLDYK
jgi:hypothetical protein